VPFLLAEPTSAVRSVFDALKLVLRQKKRSPFIMFKPTSRAPTQPLANAHAYVQEQHDGHRQHVSVASDGTVSVHGKETAELETVADSFLETLQGENLFRVSHLYLIRELPIYLGRGLPSHAMEGLT
jgi:hypothetical protein